MFDSWHLLSKQALQKHTLEKARYERLFFPKEKMFGIPKGLVLQVRGLYAYFCRWFDSECRLLNGCFNFYGYSRIEVI